VGVDGVDDVARNRRRPDAESHQREHARKRRDNANHPHRDRSPSRTCTMPLPLPAFPRNQALSPLTASGFIGNPPPGCPGRCEGGLCSRRRGKHPEAAETDKQLTAMP
jgi:hypothetical protein